MGNNVVCKIYTNSRIRDNLERNKGVVISGWLIRFSDFQRDVSFGSKFADRAVELRKKADLLRLFHFLSRVYSLIWATIGMCGPKEYGFSFFFLVINGVSIFAHF